MHACMGLFSVLAVLSVIIQLFFSASSLNGGFTTGQRAQSNGITPFVFSANIFNGERGRHRTTFLYSKSLHIVSCVSL